MQTNNGVIRTKMSAALIGAVHNSINEGHNTGKLGRLVLTAEAKGVGVKYAPRPKRMNAQEGYTAIEVLVVLIIMAFLFGWAYVAAHFIAKFW
jgi:prepilin-type N-terminal cleavage/methylation domain-containing protein